MEIADFKKLRESLNLTHSKLAKLLIRYSGDDIQKWELGFIPIPPDAASYVKNFYNQIERVSDDVVMSYKNKKEKELCVIRYISDEDLLYADQISFILCKCHETHCALTQKISAKIEKYGVSVRAINFDRVKYMTWLEKNNYSNSPARRAEWVSLGLHFPISLGQHIHMDQLISEINLILPRLKNSVLCQIKFIPKQFICSKVEIFKSAILFGIIELTEEALLLYQKERFIPSAILARAVYERFAVLYSLKKLIQRSIEEDALSEANEKLNKLFAGSRLRVGDVDYQSTNILTHIEKMEEEFFSDISVSFIYDALSNYAHPNYDGVWNAYVTFNEGHAELHSHDKGNIGNTILIALSIALTIGEMLRDDLSDLLLKYEKKYFPSAIAE